MDSANLVSKPTLIFFRMRSSRSRIRPSSLRISQGSIEDLARISTGFLPLPMRSFSGNSKGEFRKAPWSSHKSPRVSKSLKEVERVPRVGKESYWMAKSCNTTKTNGKFRCWFCFCRVSCCSIMCVESSPFSRCIIDFASPFSYWWFIRVDLWPCACVSRAPSVLCLFVSRTDSSFQSLKRNRMMSLLLLSPTTTALRFPLIPFILLFLLFLSFSFRPF